MPGDDVDLMWLVVSRRHCGRFSACRRRKTVPSGPDEVSPRDRVRLGIWRSRRKVTHEHPPRVAETKPTPRALDTGACGLVLHVQTPHLRVHRDDGNTIADRRIPAGVCSGAHLCLGLSGASRHHRACGRVARSGTTPDTRRLVGGGPRGQRNASLRAVGRWRAERRTGVHRLGGNARYRRGSFLLEQADARRGDGFDVDPPGGRRGRAIEAGPCARRGESADTVGRRAREIAWRACKRNS